MTIIIHKGIRAAEGRGLSLSYGSIRCRAWPGACAKSWVPAPVQDGGGGRERKGEMETEAGSDRPRETSKSRLYMRKKTTANKIYNQVA